VCNTITYRNSAGETMSLTDWDCAEFRTSWTAYYTGACDALVYTTNTGYFDFGFPQTMPDGSQIGRYVYIGSSLSNYFMRDAPISVGSYKEGISGSCSTIAESHLNNPAYPVWDAANNRLADGVSHRNSLCRGSPCYVE
jgi:hypothetical protein